MRWTMPRGEPGWRWRPVRVAVRVAAVLLAVILAVPALQARAAVLLWAPFHAARLRAALSQDGIVAPWDAWGFAGLENDSYLAIDTRDALRSVDGQQDWLKRVGQSCEIADARRLWPRIYLVTTFNCTFEGISPAG